MAGKVAVTFLVAGVLAAILAGLLRSRGGERGAATQYKTLASVKPDLAGADPRLKAIYAQASELLPGGAPAFTRRMRELRGLPVVVNKWGSWCNPCREEFPSFQGAGKRLGGDVAFLGADVDDGMRAARAFLRRFPVPYPSYRDESLKIAARLPPAGFAPITAFFDRRGVRVHTHAGPYRSTAALERDIRRYLLAPVPRAAGR